ncbi:MAG: NADH-quinone oxidoreductase subunit NuoE [Rhodospirillaceae bacterium]|nr:NADH-quinone oxidoreductase subunit NuoE [Rhodospirillaceae bacterium]|tara:strand:+ start:467 stop:1051 length:585 start_codon:yes stop_codon:yes gene_type:complete
MSGAFAFDDTYRARAETIVARYPEGRQQSAVIPLLDLAQRQAGGWLRTEAIEYVAAYLGMPKIRVLEVASFYSMFNLEPVGTNFVQLCRTTPCWLRGSDDLRAVAKEVTGCELGETSEDGVFTVVEVECLGACCNAPMVQINDDYYEDLTADSFRVVLEALKCGETPETGSQSGRKGSEPAGELTSLNGVGKGA